MAKAKTRKKKTAKRRRKIGNWPDLFEQANFTLVSYETTTLVLGVIVATSGDAGTKMRCHRALQGLRRLRKLVKGY